MVRNNIVIKINDQIVDYDEDTAIGITFNSYKFDDISNVWMNHTNNFSLPITKNNKKIFSFAENTCSNPNIVYDDIDTEIIVDGVVIFKGSMYVDSIDTRYNVIFTENKNVFNKLDELPFVSYYKNGEIENSLGRLVIDYWNNNIQPKLQTTYNPTTTEEWLTAAYDYCTEVGEHSSTVSAGYSPKNDFCIPWVLNPCGKQIPYVDKDDSDVKYKSNDYFVDYDIYYGYGFNVFRNISLWDDDSPRTLVRSGMGMISPLWISIDLVVKLFEDYTGWKFNNLKEIIQEFNGEGDRLFMHLNSVELLISMNATTDDKISMNFNGYLGSNNIGSYDEYGKITSSLSRGYKLTDGSYDDLSESDFSTKTSLDILKVLMQDYCLTVKVDSSKKELNFYKVNEAIYTDETEKQLVEVSEKKFSIENINQKQSIQYNNYSDYKVSFQLDCDNKNIDVGEYDNALITIDRSLFADVKYKLGSFRLKKFDLDIPDYTEENINNLNITMALPIKTNSRRYECDLVTAAGIYIIDGENNGGIAYHPTISDVSRQFVIYNRQSIVGDYEQYDLFSKMIKKPVNLKATVKKDLKFLFNWNALNVVHINGLTGKYFVQSVSSFNPRTDDTMELELIKLPADYSVYYTLNLAVYPEDSGTITPTSGSKYAEGETVRVTATANDGYWFKNWSDGVLSHIRDVYMDSNKNLVAKFGYAPQGYTRLDYIQSSGSQFINTGYIPQGNFDIDIKAQFTANYNSTALFGLYDNDSGILDYQTTTSAETIYTTANSYQTLPYVKNINVIKTNGTTLTVNGTNYTIERSTTSSNPFYLFAIDLNGTAGWYGSGRIYYAKLYENGVLVRNYIPVVHNSSGVIGMYDLVNNEFHQNSGSGTFTFGGYYVTDDEITKLEYIQSTGTQYIDTEYGANNNTIVECNLYNTSASTTGIFGSRDSLKHNAFCLLIPYTSYGSYAGIGNVEGISKTIDISSKSNIKMYGSGNLVVNGNIIYSLSPSTFYTKPIPIFKWNAESGSDFYGSFTLYDFTIKENDTVVKTLVPAKYNNEIGMYDTTQHIFHKNMGNEAFIAGPEV